MSVCSQGPRMATRLLRQPNASTIPSYMLRSTPRWAPRERARRVLQAATGARLGSLVVARLMCGRDPAALASCMMAPRLAEVPHTPAEALARSPSLLQAARPAWKRALRAVRIWLRRLMLLALWSPVVASGVPVLALHTLRAAPEWLRDGWFWAALQVVQLSGPALIKGVQWACTRKDLFPEDFCRRFSKLQSSNRAHPWRATAETLDAELGASWREHLRLDTSPIGSGCVAQVYRGCLLQGPEVGLPVAVKVIHPYVKLAIQADVEAMRFVARALEALPRVGWLSLVESVDEFAQLMQCQLDMRGEASNLLRFRQNFDGLNWVGFPAPVQPWVSELVLVETFEEGAPLSEFIEAQDAYTRKIARIGLETFLKMVFLDNFVHGDLHPGNMLVGNRKDGKGPKLVLLDAGIVGELSPQDMRNFVDLFDAVGRGDGRLAGQLIIERAREQRCRDPGAFCLEMEELVSLARADGLRLSKVGVGKLLASVLSLCCRHEVKLESHFASVVLSIGILEGVGRSLDPEVNILAAALPVLVRAKMQLAMDKV